MADELDLFLTSALAPPQRLPDRRFVATVQARILLEERFAAQRRHLLASMASQLAGLVAVTAAALWISRGAPAANVFADAPWLGVLTLLIAFGFVVAMFSKLMPRRMGSFGTS